MSDNNSSNIDTSTEGLLSHSLVLFGALGDLSLRKLMPALYQLEHAQLLSDDLKIMAVARSAFNNDELKARIADEAKEAMIAERRLIDWILQGFENEFLSDSILNNYLKNRVNISMERIGIDPQFDVNLDILKKTEWMDEEVYASALSDFFHKKPIDYTKNNKSFNADELF